MCSHGYGRYLRLMVVAVGFSVGSSIAVADEATILQPITQLYYNASADYTFVIGANAWGAPSCASAFYVQITNAVAGRKQMLALALAAKQAGTPVRFRGLCSSQSGYFDATYIEVR